MTREELIHFFQSRGYKLSPRSDRLLISPKGTARVALNPRHVRFERRHQFTGPFGGTETVWRRRASSAYKHLYINEAGKIASLAWVK